MSFRIPAPVLAGLLVLALAGSAAARSDGINPSILAPGLLQADESVSRLERLVEEAEAIGTAIFRVHNEFGELRAAIAKGDPACDLPWLLDLGARSREFGRAFRDAVQSVRVQARRVEAVTVEPTVQPLLDPETTHRVTTLLARVDDLVRRYPETSSWQEQYVEPVLRGCEPALVPGAGFPDAIPAPPPRDEPSRPGAPRKRRAPLVAVLAFGGGYLCPGAVPAAGVMLVSGAICYSESESCGCEPSVVSPATVLGPEANAGSAN